MYKIWLSAHFYKQLKPLAKKYRHLSSDIDKCLTKFKNSDAIHLGEQVYKTRLKSTDIQRGKNKSFRLIVLLIKTKGLVVPIAIYFKGDREDISKLEVNYHLSSTIHELKHSNMN